MNQTDNTTPEEQQELELARRDLRDVLATEHGVRVIARLLDDLGACRLMATENDMRMRNIVDQIITQAADAHPTAAARIVCGMYGIGAAKPVIANPATMEDNNG